MRILRVIAIGLMIAATTGAAAAQPRGDRLNFGLTGSAPQQGVRNPTYLLNQAPIQAVVLEATRGPLSEARLVELMAASDARPQDLVDTGLLARLEDGRYRLAMNLYTVADQRLLRDLADRRGRSLADAFLARRSDIEALLARYDLETVARPMVAMALVGAVVLDWDGLGVTSRDGYRVPGRDRGELGTYAVWGREIAPDLSRRALYWGSHNDQLGNIWVTTFGDHHSQPRAALPDIAWNLGPSRLDPSLPVSARRVLAAGLRRGIGQMRDDAATVMVALRAGRLRDEAVAIETGLDQERAQAALAMLEELGYVRRGEGASEPLVPVFTVARDSEMIVAVRALGQEIIHAWLRSNYAAIRRELSGLSALRAGVPYEELFTEIWHDLFGWTNYHLVRSGMLADPYGPRTTFTGFVPFVWEAPLVLNDY